MRLDLRRHLAVLAIGAGSVIAAGSALVVAEAATVSLTITSGSCSGGGTSYCFTPESANATKGDTATWTNNSGVNHTVTSCDAINCPGAPANSGGQTFDVAVNAASTGSVTFTQAGTYTYYCKIHGYTAMHGAITVAAASSSSGGGTTSPGGTGAAASPPTPSTGAGAGGIAAGLALVILGGLTLRRRLS